jgi:hypothetical protein
MEALRAALAEAKGDALVTLIGSLGDRRDAACRAAFIRLAADENPVVAEAALVALGKVSGPEAAAALAKARTAGPEKLRPVAAQASLQCAEGLIAQGKPADADAIYRDLMDPGQTLVIRRGALCGRLALGGPEAANLVLETLAGKDKALQATAIAAVRTLRGEGVTPRFATAGFVDAFDGEGIAYAIRSGQLAADAALAAARQGDFSRRALASYEAACRREIEPDLRASLTLSRLGRRWPQVFMRAVAGDARILGRYIRVPAGELSTRGFLRWLLLRAPMAYLRGRFGAAAAAPVSVPSASPVQP